MNATEHSLPFITGMGYRSLCDYVFDEFDKFNIKNMIQKDGVKIFVKTDMLDEFINDVLPSINCKFNLYTHNSDLPIDQRYSNLINDEKLICWYGQNISYQHPKLKSIPIGIANNIWGHGNIDILQKVIDKNTQKENLIYCNIDVNTNYFERIKCLEHIKPIENDTRKDFETYLTNIAKSYFIISPNGNGIDCHKHWESLYLKTIPIVTDSINISFYKEYPFLIIKDWSEFKKLNLSKELYDKIWNNFNLKRLFL